MSAVSLVGVEVPDLRSAAALGRVPLGLVEAVLAAAPDHSTGLAVDLDQRRLERAQSRRTRATPAMNRAIVAAPNSGTGDAIVLPPPSAYRTASLASSSSSPSRSPSSAAARKRWSRSVAGLLVGVEARAACLHVLARAGHELARVDLGPLDDLADLRVAVAEHLAQEVGGPLDRRQALQQYQQAPATASRRAPPVTAGPGSGSSSSGSGSHGPT